MIEMEPELSRNTGSFRDPDNRVYEIISNDKSKRILRGLSHNALIDYKVLSEKSFFQKLMTDGKIVNTKLLSQDEKAAQDIMKDGWAGVIEHEPIPLVTYPYEWTFSMLKDAALLQLKLIEESLEHGWTLKDATPYNIQWIGSRPIFIDIPSFQPWKEGEPWVGYRQFCSMFLTPLLLKAHLGIDHLPLLRSYLDGIPPTEAFKYFPGRKAFKKGVLSHIIFPAKVENSIERKERDNAPAAKRSSRKQSLAMVLGLVQSLIRLVNKLTIKNEHTDWSQYDKTHTYDDKDFELKKSFIAKHASSINRNYVWDIGCNTGTFSKIFSANSKHIISLDGDHNAVEQLYLTEKQDPHSNILPLVMNIGNISPAQGWASKERLAFDQRTKPDLVLCLALIHHIRLSANIPNQLFLKWLHSLNAEIIIEFVNRHDEMVIKLLTNKKRAI